MTDGGQDGGALVIGGLLARWQVRLAALAAVAAARVR
jgi:hypothetical protein